MLVKVFHTCFSFRERWSTETSKPKGSQVEWHALQWWLLQWWAGLYILRLGLRKRNWSGFFRAKRALFWHKEKANYAETDFLEISFYENDNYDCCSYIYKILCLNIWQYSKENWCLTKSFFLLRRIFYFGLIIKVMQVARGPLPFQLHGKYAAKPFLVERICPYWIKIETQ